MKNYKNCFVAYLDIMGFKSLLSDNSCDDIYMIFDVLQTKSKAELNYCGNDIQAYQHIHHTILSDSIILYIEEDIDDAFAALIDVCRILQKSLADRDEPILLRGGIVKGDLFYENDIIYGNGLTRAYLLESNLANYPRIVFSGDTLTDGIQNSKYMRDCLKYLSPFYLQDDDYMYYVDYIYTAGMSAAKVIQYFQYFDRLKSLCIKILSQENEHSLRDKYIWLQKKIDFSIEHNQRLKEHYDKIKELEMKNGMEEYHQYIDSYSRIGSPTIINTEF